MGDDRALNALADIRSLELEMAQRLDEARAAAEQTVAAARRHAETLVGQARERGADRAEEDYRRRLASAQNDAERIRLDGTRDAAELFRKLRPRLQATLPEMLALVVSTEPDEE